jgi:hypothetical protein
MANLSRSDLIKIKRFKESKPDYERKMQLALWFYLGFVLLLITALLLVGSDQDLAGVLAIGSIAALAPTLRTRATGKVIALVERNYDLWMRQNKIAGYSRRTNAFLLKNDDPEQAQQFHDPVCDECWHEGEALFNIDENRVRREADAESGTRVPRQSVSQLDLVDYYWSRMSLNTALKLYVTFGEVTEASLVE